MSEVYDIGLGNNDTITRKKASSDFVSFWDNEAKKLSWFSPWNKTLDWQPPFGRWFSGGTINASYNALDIHQETLNMTNLPFCGREKMESLEL